MERTDTDTDTEVAGCLSRGSPPGGEEGETESRVTRQVCEGPTDPSRAPARNSGGNSDAAADSAALSSPWPLLLAIDRHGRRAFRSQGRLWPAGLRLSGSGCSTYTHVSLPACPALRRASPSPTTPGAGAVGWVGIYWSTRSASPIHVPPARVHAVCSRARSRHAARHYPPISIDPPRPYDPLSFHRTHTCYCTAIYYSSIFIFYFLKQQRGRSVPR